MNNINSGGSEEESDETRFERRPFMKLTGAAAAGSVLAGCTGGGGEEGTPEGGETVALGGGETTTGGGQGTEKPFSGLSFKFIETMALHSPRAKRVMKKMVNRFNNDTGADCKLTIGPGAWDQKFKVLYKNNKYPPSWTPTTWHLTSIYTLNFEGDNSFMYSFKEMQDRIDDEVLQGIEWTHDGKKSPQQSTFSGWIKRGDVDLGLGAVLGDLYYSSYWLANKKHFEEAGLDPAEDFPPQNYDELLEVGRTLDENAPSNTGLQLVGSGDLNDAGIPPWAVNLGGRDGMMLSEDWTTTQFENDTWNEACKLYTEVYTKHGLGSPESPTIDDESTTVLIAKGDVSMGSVEPLTIPLVIDQNPEMIENQTAMWGPNYMPHGKGDDWQPGIHGPYIFQPNKKPPKADAGKWEKKVDASYKLFNDYIMNKDFQQLNFPNDLGVIPMRNDVWDSIFERMEQEYPRHMIVSSLKQVEESDFAWPAHPAGVPGDQFSAEMEVALKGDQSVSKGLSDAKADFQKVIDDSVFGSA